MCATCTFSLKDCIFHCQGFAFCGVAAWNNVNLRSEILVQIVAAQRQIRQGWMQYCEPLIFDCQVPSQVD